MLDEAARAHPALAGPRDPRQLDELDGGPQFQAEEMAGYNRTRRTLWTDLVVPQGETIPEGIARLKVKSAYVAIGGPWELTWNVVGGDRHGAPLR